MTNEQAGSTIRKLLLRTKDNSILTGDEVNALDHACLVLAEDEDRRQGDKIAAINQLDKQLKRHTL